MQYVFWEVGGNQKRWRKKTHVDIAVNTEDFGVRKSIHSFSNHLTTFDVMGTNTPPGTHTHRINLQYTA